MAHDDQGWRALYDSCAPCAPCSLVRDKSASRSLSSRGVKLRATATFCRSFSSESIPEHTVATGRLMA